MKSEVKIAVLIDAENVSAKYIEYVLTELSNHGIPTIKRAYGDWTKKQLNPWKRVLLNNSIIPEQQFSYTTGKNATDSALIIDAMDILHASNVDAYCIVSSDSDFTRLAARIRESGHQVIGMGEKKTPTAFINACDLFRYLEVLEKTHKADSKTEEQSSTNNQPTKSSILSRKALINSITKIIEDHSDEDEWIGLGEVGSRLQKRHPDFDSRNYGYSKLSSLIRSFDTFDMELRKSEGNPRSRDVYVKIKSSKN